MANLPYISSKKNDFRSIYGDISSSDMKNSVMGVYDSGRGGVGSNFKDNMRFNKIVENTLSEIKKLVDIGERSLELDEFESVSVKNIIENKPNTIIPSTIKEEKKTDTPFKERIAKHMKTGNFFQDMMSGGLASIKNDLFEMTDFEIMEGIHLEDYFSPLKKLRESLDIRTKGEIERDKRVDLRSEVEELRELASSEFASPEQRKVLTEKLNEKSSLLDEMQLEQLNKITGLQEQLLETTKESDKTSLKSQQEKSIDDEKLRVKQEELAESTIQWPDNLKYIAELLKELKDVSEKCCKGVDGTSPNSGPKGKDGSFLDDILNPNDEVDKERRNDRRRKNRNNKKRSPKSKLRNLGRKLKVKAGRGLQALKGLATAATSLVSGAGLATTGAVLAGAAGAAATGYAIYEGVKTLNASKEAKDKEKFLKEQQKTMQSRFSKNSSIDQYSINVKNKQGKVDQVPLSKYLADNPKQIRILRNAGVLIAGNKSGKLPSVDESKASEFGLVKTKDENGNPMNTEKVKSSISSNVNRVTISSNLNKSEQTLKDTSSSSSSEPSAVVQQNNVSRGGNTSVVNINHNGNKEKTPILSQRYQNGWGGSGIF